MRFLIDECLSPTLVGVAHEAGFEAYHVAHHGWAGLKDPQLFQRILAENFVFVTNNRDDFRALVGDVELHPGLVVILENAPRAVEIEFFRHALTEIAREVAAGRNMVNTGNRGRCRWRCGALPSSPTLLIASRSWSFPPGGGVAPYARLDYPSTCVRLKRPERFPSPVLSGSSRRSRRWR